MERASLGTNIICPTISTIITFVFLYFAKIPLSFNAATFWLACITVLLIYMVPYALVNMFDYYSDGPYLSVVILGGLAVVILIIFLVVALFSAPLFNVQEFRNVVTINTEGNFDNDIPRVNDSSDIPVVDVITARKLGDRTMGVMEKYISQYEVGTEYNLITYQGKYYRISPMEYGGFFKWKNSNATGIPGYVLVDVYTGESKLIELPEGKSIKYSPSACFGDNLTRYILSKYPSALIQGENFEIDEEGTPYYVVPTLKSTAGLFGARVIDRVILVNAVTGECINYALSEVPNWVDNVFDTDFLMKKVEYHYDLVHGVFNFSNKDVRKTSYSFDSSQYYFIPKDNDVYLYTGVTSAGNDESNIGFLLANMRTGEVTYYPNPGAEESSAQGSAEGLVQQYGYDAGPVMLVNINGIESYFMTLKDDQQLIKKYALVNKSDYNICVVEDTIELAVSKYITRMNNSTEMIEALSMSKTGVIAEVYEIVIDANTTYVFKLNGDETVYCSAVSNSLLQPFMMQVGNVVEISYISESNSDYAVVNSITFK